MTKTTIEWATKVWNPLRGCSKVSEGCRNCYAIRQAHRFSGVGQPYEGLTERTNQGINWTGKVMLLPPEKLLTPLSWKKPERIFVNSMSDLFHEDVPNEFIRRIFSIMGEARHHQFMILTKRPKRMKEVITEIVREGDFATLQGSTEPPFPWPNVLLGVSVENQQAANERIPELLQTPAAIRFLSCEPLLGPVEILEELMQGVDPGKCGNCGKSHGFTRCSNYGRVSKISERYRCHDFKRVDFAIDWVVVGGESGHKARPMELDWARSLRDQCQAAAVPFFMKQMGSVFAKENGFLDPKGCDWSEWNQEFKIREFPGQFQKGGLSRENCV